MPLASCITAGDVSRRREKARLDEDAADKGSAEERVERERARMVEARQNELDRVSERHDSYVRVSVTRRFHVSSNKLPCYPSLLAHFVLSARVLPLSTSYPSMMEPR